MSAQRHQFLVKKKKNIFKSVFPNLYCAKTMDKKTKHQKQKCHQGYIDIANYDARIGFLLLLLN